jgi:small redox-active disulfide protein 2
MINIKVLGTGCKKCAALKANVETALQLSGAEAEIEKVEDINEIVGFGVMSTPALVIDGTVRVTGRVPTPEDIVKLLQQ